ncbi:hypothetical protein [Vagococcus fluvialis]|uniref:hypothetical protein n=1 Tax=Vagococcus fluvialis TaxID=2738 RepID=UPI003B21B644
MNYRDYVEIMKSEGLYESLSVKSYLKSAMYWQKAIKNLSKYDVETKNNLVKKFEELKIKAILAAIDIARFEKDLGFRIEEDYDKLMEFIGEGGLNK